MKAKKPWSSCFTVFFIQKGLSHGHYVRQPLHEKLRQNKKLQKAAQNNGEQMFANNVFPGIFDDTAQAAYMESTETYTRLFQDAEKYRAIMGALTSAMFHEFRTQI